MGIEEFLLDRAKKKGYKEGLKIAEMERNTKFTRNMLTLTDYSITKIAELVGVSEDFVLKVKKELGK